MKAQLNPKETFTFYTKDMNPIRVHVVADAGLWHDKRGVQITRVICKAVDNNQITAILPIHKLSHEV